MSAAAANPRSDCPDCYGEGTVTVEYNNNPNTQREVRCACLEADDDDTDRCPACGVDVDDCRCPGRDVEGR